MRRAAAATPPAVDARRAQREAFPWLPVAALLLVVAVLIALWLRVALVRARKRAPGTDPHDDDGPP